MGEKKKEGRTLKGMGKEGEDYPTASSVTWAQVQSTILLLVQGED